MTDALFTYLKKCPLFAHGCLNIDYLGKDAMSASLSGAGKTEVLRAYTDGDAMKKDTYTLALRLPFGIDTAENKASNEQVAKVLKWIREQNKRGILPELSGQDFAVSVSCEAEKEAKMFAADSFVRSIKIGVVYYSVR